MNDTVGNKATQEASMREIMTNDKERMEIAERFREYLKKEDCYWEESDHACNIPVKLIVGFYEGIFTEVTAKQSEEIEALRNENRDLMKQAEEGKVNEQAADYYVERLNKMSDELDMVKNELSRIKEGVKGLHMLHFYSLLGEQK